MDKQYYVYILSNKRYGTLYIGITSDLIRRVWQHKEKLNKGFTAKYDLDKLVYFETFSDVGMAIAREKRIKNYRRQWKINLIEYKNLYWEDLYYSLL